MNSINYFEELIESVSDYRKLVLLIFLIKDYTDLLEKFGFVKRDIERLTSEFKTILSGQIDEYYSYLKNQEESIIERIPNK